MITIVMMAYIHGLFVDPQNYRPHVLVTAVFIAIITAQFFISHGITTVFPHIYYIPILIAAYYYPSRAIVITAVIGLIYLTQLLVFLSPGQYLIVSALIRVIMFMFVATVVSVIAGKLKRSEVEYRSIFENTGIATVIVSHDGSILKANSKFEEITSHSMDKINDSRWNDFVVPDEDQSAETTCDICKKYPLQNPWQYETDILDEERNAGTYNLSIAQIPDTDNFVLSMLDITPLRQAENALRKSEERLNLAIDGAKLGIWDVDLTAGTEQYNERWATMLGLPCDKLTGRWDSWINCIHPDDRPSVMKAINECLEGKTQYYNPEFRIKNNGNGNWRWISSVGEVVEHDSSGKPVRMAGIHQDISEKWQHQNALKEANKKLNLLSGITRHDILNQISVLSGYTVLLAEDIPEGTPAGNYLRRISDAAGTIQRQITFTGDYQEMGVKTPCWQNVLNIARSSFSLAGIGHRISLSVDTGALEIFADPMLGKVFYNLFDNSARYGESVTNICILFHEEGNTGMIVVSDNGAGIADENKSRIFERGFGKNTGYGLFLSHEILSITGISITENGKAGQGATFMISVPREGYRYGPDHQINSHDKPQP